VQRRQRLWIGPGFGIVLDDAVDCLAESNQRETSLAMISASTRMAVLNLNFTAFIGQQTG
jgi:hypothetical protein